VEARQSVDPGPETGPVTEAGFLGCCPADGGTSFAARRREQPSRSEPDCAGKEVGAVRIAIVAPPVVPVPPPAYGGTERVLDVLARGLQAAGHEVVLFCTGDSSCPVPRAWVYEEALGVGAPGPVPELRQALAAYEAVQDCDVVHDHTLVGPLVADRFPWLAVVTTNHGPFVGDLGVIYRAISQRVPVIAISHHQASTASGVQLAGVVHHGLDLDQFPVGTGRGGFALFLGRMHPDKGVHLAARVARRAGVPLKIAAKMQEPAERAYFEAEVAPLLGGPVEYVGEVGGQEKLELLGEASCLLNPIQWPEPFGMVMIEALASGTPVVATPMGSAPEIVEPGRTGFLGVTEEELVAGVQRAAELDRQACRRSAEVRFSAERMVRDHLRIYERVMAARRADLFGALERPGWLRLPERSGDLSSEGAGGARA